MTHFSTYHLIRILVFMIVCMACTTPTGCGGNSITNDDLGSNHYTFYPDGQLKSIMEVIKKLLLTKDRVLENWGKLFKIKSRDSISIDKQLLFLYEAETFKGILLYLQTRILDSLQDFVWDTVLEVAPPKTHGFEVFSFKKESSDSGRISL